MIEKKRKSWGMGEGEGREIYDPVMMIGLLSQMGPVRPLTPSSVVLEIALAGLIGRRDTERL